MRDSIERAAEAFCARKPGLATARGSFDRCRKTSEDLAKALRRAGFEATVIRMAEGTRVLPDADPRWLKLGSKPGTGASFWWTHYAVLCDGWVVDAAFRQFDPSCAHPRVTTLARARSEWSDVSVLGPDGTPRPLPAREDAPRGTKENRMAQDAETLVARVSASFDPRAPAGLLVAAADLGDTYGFTEKGYDTADYDAAPNVVSVDVLATNLASAQDVELAAERAGVKIWLTKDEYIRFWPGATESEWREGAYPEDGTEPNVLLENPAVRAEVEAAGFDGFRDNVVVGNTEPMLTVLWRPDTFEVTGEVEVVADDGNHPYHVRLADTAPRP